MFVVVFTPLDSFFMYSTLFSSFFLSCFRNLICLVLIKLSFYLDTLDMNIRMETHLYGDEKFKDIDEVMELEDGLTNQNRLYNSIN